MKLNYKVTGQGKAIILLHGMFGSLDNLNGIAKALCDNYQLIQVDLRNHGHSFWHNEMNYHVMAKDIVKLMNHIKLDSVSVIGHSIGGKVAMTLANIAPEYIEKIAILDIAPVAYQLDRHLDIFAIFDEIKTQQLNDRKVISQLMLSQLSQQTTQFLLKSYKNQAWLFNIDVIKRHYSQLCDWQTILPCLKPTLFVKGQMSDYLLDEYVADILVQFPYSEIVTITNAGHNVHFDNPHQVLTELKQWLLLFK